LPDCPASEKKKLENYGAAFLEVLRNA
jgi:hypothetical protein